jgi:sulfocyanin
MSNSSPVRRPTLWLLSGALMIMGSACSKGADQRPAVDSGTSSAAVGSPGDSTTIRDSGITSDTMAHRDSTTAPEGSTSTTRATQQDSSDRAQASTAAKPTPVKPPVKPNIDPGRVTPKPRTPAAPDSAESTSATPASQPAASGQQDQPLKYDAASNTVTFQLIGGPNGFQFNGYASGGATLTLPSKANVVINFVNKDGTPHSAEVISGEGPIPNAGGDAAIPRAYTNQLSQGLPQEATDVMRFTVPASGKYRIFCGVPGHGLSGMWIWMVVDPAAKTPSFGPTKA